ncbi:transposase family protein [Amycolatopsis sp. NPDC059235]|uniref:transposase family protein n=1 Tax=Amycolatopsis sp. NPDC059235 TaxID=3346782 RepID=UPI003673303E
MNVLLPHLAALRIERIIRRGPALRLQASVLAPDAACPSCGSRSGRVHSRYDRYLSDPAIGGQETVICLQVRRFSCDLRSACSGRSPNRSPVSQPRTPAGLRCRAGCWRRSRWRWVAGRGNGWPGNWP